MSTDKILKACEKAYNKGKGGKIQGAIDMAAKHKVKTYSFCAGCNAEQPMVGKWCCVCGSKTENKSVN
ncbi:MAG TPA: hypothetical protein VNX68_07670 [Nitrosopumilaceae archaeon]|jgi:hypothetical protein|nr:hypothetical protein [Nitrosopumilaceae archaeon]